MVLTLPSSRKIRFTKIQQFVGKDASNIFLTLAIRGFGGLAGVLPAIVALQFLDRVQYGRATANFAIALMLLGPVQHYLSYGYLRSLRNAAGVIIAPAGSIPFWLYVTAVEIGLSLLSFTGILPKQDVLLIATTFLPAVWLKVQEPAFISRGWPNAAAVLFFVLPACIQCILILVFKATTNATDFEIVSIAQILALILCVAICFFIIPQAWRQIIPLNFPASKAEWVQEFGAVRSFFVSGTILGITEQIPVILLRAFQFEYAIAAFELARKIASVPSLIITGFVMHLNVRLIDHVREGAWVAFRATLKKFTLMQAPLGLAYVGAAFIVLSFFRHELPFLQQLEPAIWEPLLIGSLVSTISGPFGSSLVALRGERWWAIGSIVSLTAQLGISFIGRDSLGVSSVCWGILFQNITVTAFVVCGALTIYAEKSSNTNLNYGKGSLVKKS